MQQASALTTNPVTIENFDQQPIRIAQDRPESGEPTTPPGWTKWSDRLPLKKLNCSLFAHKTTNKIEITMRIKDTAATAQLQEDQQRQNCGSMSSRLLRIEWHGNRRRTSLSIPPVGATQWIRRNPCPYGSSIPEPRLRCGCATGPSGTRTKTAAFRPPFR